MRAAATVGTRPFLRAHTHCLLSAFESSDTHVRVSISQRIVLVLFSDGILTVGPCWQSFFFFFISGLVFRLSLTLESSQQAGHLTQVNHAQTLHAKQSLSKLQMPCWLEFLQSGGAPRVGTPVDSVWFPSGKSQIKGNGCRVSIR